MNIMTILKDKAFKSIDKKKAIAKALEEKQLTISELTDTLCHIAYKNQAVIFEAIEAVTNADPQLADIDWLRFVEKYILSESNSMKREASRIVGNLAHRFPNELGKAIEKLLVNSNDQSTVVRWGSAYALSRIIVIPQHANSELYNILTEICSQEDESGVKNQYVKALRKAVKVRI